jgi:biopolymer transport protein ExbB/TolQ
MPQILTIIIKGGIVMIPLLACSLISLALSIERILFGTRLKSKAVINEILALVEKGEYEQALKLGKTRRSQSPEYWPQASRTATPRRPRPWKRQRRGRFRC